MITGRQIREAIALLGWTPLSLAVRALLTLDDVCKALDATNIRRLGGLQLGAIRDAFEAAGVEFSSEVNGRAAARLQKTEPAE